MTPGATVFIFCEDSDLYAHAVELARILPPDVRVAHTSEWHSLDVLEPLRAKGFRVGSVAQFWGPRISVEATDPETERVFQALAEDAGFEIVPVSLLARRGICVWSAFFQYKERYVAGKRNPLLRGPVPGWDPSSGLSFEEAWEEFDKRYGPQTSIEILLDLFRTRVEMHACITVLKSLADAAA